MSPLLNISLLVANKGNQKWCLITIDGCRSHVVAKRLDLSGFNKKIRRVGLMRKYKNTIAICVTCLGSEAAAVADSARQINWTNPWPYKASTFERGA